MAIRFQRESWLLTAGLLIFGFADSAAAQSCNGLLSAAGVSSRQLYRLPQRTIVPEGRSESLEKPDALTLAYVVPGHRYVSGAVIIKSRHRLAAAATSPKTLIRARRLAYNSPCTQRDNQLIQEYDNDAVDPERYINFQKFRLPDARGRGGSLSALHADIGNRPPNNWDTADSRCASTADDDIRPHFLYEDSLADRQPVSGWRGAFQYGAGRGSALRRALSPSTAYALPVEYAGIRRTTRLSSPTEKQRRRCHASQSPYPFRAMQSKLGFRF